MVDIEKFIRENKLIIINSKQEHVASVLNISASHLSNIVRLKYDLSYHQLQAYLKESLYSNHEFSIIHELTSVHSNNSELIESINKRVWQDKKIQIICDKPDIRVLIAQYHTYYQSIDLSVFSSNEMDKIDYKSIILNFTSINVNDAITFNQEGPNNISYSFVNINTNDREIFIYYYLFLNFTKELL